MRQRRPAFTLGSRLRPTAPEHLSPCPQHLHPALPLAHGLYQAQQPQPPWLAAHPAPPPARRTLRRYPGPGQYDSPDPTPTVSAGRPSPCCGPEPHGPR